MAPLVESLEQLGYIDGENLFGAPYDFRYGLAMAGHPSRVGSKLNELKSLVEEASNSNGGKPVILVSHILGGLYVLELLNQNPTSWRKKFVKHFIALFAPWCGTVDEMSNLWLLPNPKMFDVEKPLVTTLNRSYSAHDMVDFLKDIGYPKRVYPYET
ncbi:unnamed protein product [Lathyrus sativus]|nr:unnamed protein product [Lathyrus sativus]